MEWLSKSYVQLVGRFQAMTPAARACALLLVAVVIGCLVYLAGTQFSPADSYLLGGEMFSASQLREIQTALGKAGLEAQVEGARVRVPRGQESKYMAALADSGALVDFGSYLKKAVNGNSFMVYGPQQEARNKVALLSELQLAISRMPGIESAFVHIDQESRRGFREPNVLTASVAVQPRGNKSLDDAMVAAIRGMVAASRVGLKPEGVTVVDLSGPRLFAGNGGDPKSLVSSGTYADYKKRLEQDWQEKISRLLAQIVPGALVTTNVELDPEVSNEEKLTEYSAAAAEARVSAPTTEKHIVREGRTPKRVTVSVAIPHTYYEEVWRKQHVSPYNSTHVAPDAAALIEIEAAEKKKIEAAILPLLGNTGLSPDAASQVAVTTFYPPQPIEQAQPTAAEMARVWLAENWRALGLGCLALMALAMLRSLVRGAPVNSAGSSARMVDSPTAAVPRPHVAVSTPQPLDHQREDAQPAVSAPNARGSAALREELSDIVRGHPDSAASLLRTWIGNAQT